MKKTNRCNQKHQHELQTAEGNWFFSTLSDEAKELMEEQNMKQFYFSIKICFKKFLS